MADETERPSVKELKAHLGTLESVDEVEALREGEDRATALEAIDARVDELQTAEPQDPNEVVYGREDLLSSAAAHGTTEAGMAGALRQAGLEDGATLDEAKAAVEAFNTQEV